MPGRALLATVLLVALLTSVPPCAWGQENSDESSRPRGGLFSEEGTARQALSPGWFLLGLYVLLGLLFAGAAAHLAVQKGLAPIPWFFIGFFLNAPGYLVLLTRPAGDLRRFLAGIPGGLRKVPCTHEHLFCDCGYFNHPAAHYCSACLGEKEPQFESEAARWRQEQEPN